MPHTIEEVRTKTGEGLADIKRCMVEWPTDDPLLAAYYSIAKSHAIAVHGIGDARDKRDREWAEHRLTW